MQHAVRAMDSISRALVRTVEGPRGAARGGGPRGRGAPERRVDRAGAVRRPPARAPGPGSWPPTATASSPSTSPTCRRSVQLELESIRAGHTRPVIEPSGWIRVPMTLEGRTVGSLVAQHRLQVDPEPGDLSVLRILANQAAVSLHTSEQYQAGLDPAPSGAAAVRRGDRAGPRPRGPDRRAAARSRSGCCSPTSAS